MSQDGLFDQIAVPLLVLDEPLPGISDVAGKKISVLTVAETFVQTPKVQRSVKIARKVIKFYKGLKSVAESFGDSGGMLLAEDCVFRPGEKYRCTGGLFANDGSGRALSLTAEEDHEEERLQRELDAIFPPQDAGGFPITPIHRDLDAGTCQKAFDVESGCGDTNSCGCTGTEKAKCKAKQLKCKSQSAGLSLPFLEDPTSLLGLFSGEDIQLIRFQPPVLEFAFEYEMFFLLFTPPTVNLGVSFGFSVTVEFAVVLDT
eukprot:14700484-Ditylum_brightwellii.AAC.2